MTKLNTYLDDNSVRQKDFAEKVGITQAHLSNISQGRRNPSAEVIFKINEVTNGAVPVESWAEQILGDDSSGSSQNEKHS